jgi:hypothetical protein
MAYTDRLLYPDIREVPAEHREEWVRLVNPDDRDPAWMQYLTPEEQERLKEEVHPDRDREPATKGNPGQKSTPEKD